MGDVVGENENRRQRRRTGGWKNLFQNNSNFLVCQNFSDRYREFARALLQDQSEEFVLDLYSSSQLLLTVSCYICKQPMIDCSALRCGHTFCNFCIRSFLSVDQHCPRCGIYCREVTIDTVYDIEGAVDVGYPQLLHTFQREEVDPAEVLAQKIFSSKYAAWEMVESPAQEYPFYSTDYRQLLKEERRKVSQDLRPVDEEGNSILHAVMELSFNGSQGIRIVFQIVLTFVLFLLVVVVAETLIGRGDQMQGVIWHVGCLCGAFVMTFVVKKVYSEALAIGPWTRPFTNLFVRRRETEQEETVFPMNWDTVYDTIIDTIGPRKVHYLCETKLMEDGSYVDWDDLDDDDDGGSLSPNSNAFMSMTQGESILNALSSW